MCKEVIVSFTPHLAPMKGYAGNHSLDLIDTDVTADDIRSVFFDYYRMSRCAYPSFGAAASDRWSQAQIISI